MKAKLILIVLFSVIVGLVELSAQSEMVLDTSQNILLLKERSIGAIFHTQGWGIKYSRGIHKTAFTKRVWVIEMVEMKSEKQIRIINPYFTNAKSFVYGKLNSVFIFRGSYGNHKQLNRKPYWGGVELRLLYMGGFSLGVAKPVYLQILNHSVADIYTTTIERYDPYKHSIDDIFGRGPFTKGFNQISVYPGLHLKAGLDFDYAAYNTKVKSLEVGAMLDIFPRPVPIMAFNEPNYYFFTFYLSFSFGKRFN
jgi:hypothetical protein